MIKRNIKILFIFLLSFSSFSILAQSGVVSGKVVDESGEGIPGVNVIVDGTTNGISSDINGNYKINVNSMKSTKLHFSFIGYTTKVVEVAGRVKINVTLSSENFQLGEIVVSVGYGTRKKRDLTGAVSSVSVKEIERTPVANISQIIGGRVAGVKLSSSEGQPGSAISIRVRGGGSVTQSNEPIYIVDGFPMEDGIDFLDPNDIETMDILKDASSTAIYGARGANGVILITTKGGQPGKTTINYDGHWGFKELNRKMNVLSPLEFAKLQYERDINEDEDALKGFNNVYGQWDDLESTYGGKDGVDWQEEAFGESATTQKHKISIMGGSKETSFNLSASNTKQDGIMVNSGYEHSMAKLKMNHTVNSRIKASGSFNYYEQEVWGMGTSDQGGYFNKMQHIIQYRPTIGKDGNDEDLLTLDEDPALVDESGNVMQNPVVSANAETKRKIKKNLSINGGLSIELLENLTYKITAGLLSSNQRDERFMGERSLYAKRKGAPYGSLAHVEKRNWNVSNVLTYKKKINKRNKFDLMLGQEYNYENYLYSKINVSSFPNDDIGLADLSLATPGIAESRELDRTMLSVFGRLFYSYDNKYLLTMTLRNDGSSKFPANSKYALFPSASFAWRASEESFIKNLNLFSNLKMRLSYGAVGNNRIPDYRSIGLYNSVDYSVNNTVKPGVAPAHILNPDLKWETTKSFNFGLDMGFFNQRLNLTAELYSSNTEDLLLQSKLPTTSGYSSVIQNVGETQNRGVEITLLGELVKTKNFKWTTNFNISTNRNEVIALNSGQQSFTASSNWGGIKEHDFIVEVGQPLGQMYGYVYDGIYQVSDFDENITDKWVLKEGIAENPNNKARPGGLKLKDVGGADGVKDGKVDANDRTVIGNATPDFYGGITNIFSYKGFDLSLFMSFSVGGDIYNANKLYYTQNGLVKNQRNVLDIAEDRWTTIDGDGQIITDRTQLAEINKDKTVHVFDAVGEVDPKFHSWAVEDGSYLKIKNVTLGYTLPKSILKKVNLNKVRLYVSTDNLYTFTDYSGYDPEVGTRGNGITPGVDWGAYPRSRTYICGVNISF